MFKVVFIDGYSQQLQLTAARSKVRGKLKEIMAKKQLYQ